MAKLQVPIEDDLMAKLKTEALNKGITLKELVTAALSSCITTEPQKTQDYVTKAQVEEMIQAALMKSNQMDPKKEEPEPTEPEYEVDENGCYMIDEFVDPEEYKFEYVDTVDLDGNPRKIRILKGEYLYGKVEDAPKKPLDPNDPIDKMLLDAGMTI